MTTNLHACEFPGCQRPHTKFSSLCEAHHHESNLAHRDWRRDDQIDLHATILQRREPREDDWRISAYTRSVLPRRVGLMAESERTTWWRMTGWEGSGRCYAPELQHPNDDLLPAEHLIHHVELKAVIERSLRLLPTTIAEIILRLRYGIRGTVTTSSGQTVYIDSDEMTFEDIGQMLDLSRERVRQHVLTGLRLLRHPTVSRRLRPFYGDR